MAKKKIDGQLEVTGQVTIPETPVADTDAASKKYVDDTAGSIDLSEYAKKIGPLPLYEVKKTDNVYSFARDHGSIPLILHVVAGNNYIGTLAVNGPSSVAFELEELSGKNRYYNHGDTPAGLTFNDIFGPYSSYRENYEISNNKVTSLSASSTDTQYPSAKLVYDKLQTKENVSNKVTALSGSSTDTQYPSAKVVFDNIQNIREVAEGKCNTYVLSNRITRIANGTIYYLNDSDVEIPMTLSAGTTFYIYNNSTKKWEDKLSNLIAGDYDNLPIANRDFDSNANSIVCSGTYGYIIDGLYVGGGSSFRLVRTITGPGGSVSSNPLHKGDIFLVVETDVPDRWSVVPSYGTLSKLETSKIDLTQYYTKDQIAALFSSYITSPYDNTSTYAVGKYVTYNGVLYRCVTAIDVAEDFDSSKWTAVTVGSELERMVTTDTEQTIQVFKTFLNGIGIGTDAQCKIERVLNNLVITSYGNLILAVQPSGHISPSRSSIDLGRDTSFRDIYVSRYLTDRTNSVTVAEIANGIFNVINASDIASGGVLTDEQIAKIINGKPTKIFGTYLEVSNPFIISVQDAGTFYRGWYAGDNKLCVFTLNKTSKVISKQAGYTQTQNLECIYSINGKTLPAYPSNTGTFVNKMINGTWSWAEEKVMTQADYDALATKDANTTYYIEE